MTDHINHDYFIQYTKNKQCYINLCRHNNPLDQYDNPLNRIDQCQDVQYNQTSGGNSNGNNYNKKYHNNVFLNKEYFGMHHVLKYRQRRLDDFAQLVGALKDYLIPKTKIDINKKLLKKYINLHKKKNRSLIRTIINNLQYITFDEFMEQLLIQINRFNDYLVTNKIKKYVFVFGATNDMGFIANDFNIFKSNLWVILLAYKHLKIKPYDIILNLNIAFRLHYPTINDFLIVDDCSYSGQQIVEGVLKTSVSELLYTDKDAFIVIDKKQPMYKPILDKNYNVHLLIPYISTNALLKINEFEMTSKIHIVKYFSQIVKTYGNILDESTIKNINNLYKKYAGFINFADLTPIYFQHKIADMVSTIDLILIKGQVLDHPTKKLVFIDECIYDKNDPDKMDLDPKQDHFLHNKLYCPVPPYLNFAKHLS